MLQVDYYFFYKYTIRFILMQKLNCIKNTYNIPNLKKLLFYFSINKLEDIDEVQGYIIYIYLSFFLVERLF